MAGLFLTNRMTDNYSALKCLIENGRGQNHKSSGGSFEEANDIFSPAEGQPRLVSVVQTFIFYTFWERIVSRSTSGSGWAQTCEWWTQWTMSFFFTKLMSTKSQSMCPSSTSCATLPICCGLPPQTCIPNISSEVWRWTRAHSGAWAWRIWNARLFSLAHFNSFLTKLCIVVLLEAIALILYSTVRQDEAIKCIYGLSSVWPKNYVAVWPFQTFLQASNVNGRMSLPWPKIL